MKAEYHKPVVLAAPGVRGRTDGMIIVLLAGLLLALGLVGWWCLARMDARYTRVVAQTATSLNQVQEIGLHAGTSFGNIIELRHARDAETLAVLRHTVEEERAANDRLYEKLNETLTEPAVRVCLQEVLAKRKVFRQEADLFMAITSDTTPAKPDAEGSLQLLHSYVAYQKACDKLTDRIEASSLEACRETTAEIRKLRWLFLGVGILPIVTVVVVLLVVLTLLRVVSLDGETE